MRSHWLKVAADTFDVFDEHHHLKEDPSGQSDLPFLGSVNLLLLGLSFENLLKALLITQGIPAGRAGKLDAVFHTHSVKALLAAVDSRLFPISAEERELLLKLERYVIWQGRYPIPLSADQYEVSGQSNSEHQVGQELWQRLHRHIKAKGWIKMMDGEKRSLMNPAGEWLSAESKV